MRIHYALNFRIFKLIGKSIKTLFNQTFRTNFKVMKLVKQFVDLRFFIILRFQF